ncbi:hypothetical protein LUX12_14965 [Streptomyces somaliensis]|uniref:hypothetical protein n=1 Tax=Streptomyces somaliensis TaxID=78355 RepID=UPI0020CCB7A7|nr:hypothetical protein [Streptomyces somaliensis]MCP9945799.1 hypothetical protein [Streptomyces somaliensis]
MTEYDVLGRKAGLWDGTKTDAGKLAAWTYDVLAKGQPDSSVRYENGVNQTTSKAYTQKVTGYNALYQPTGSQMVLPAGEPLVAAGVPATLSSSTTYGLDGSVLSSTMPAVAGLGSETVTITRGELGQETKVASGTGYLLGAAYSPQGDVRQLTLGTSSAETTKKAYVNYDYETGTRRLTRSYVTDTVHSYMPQDLQYAQDDAGNVTSIFDATTQGGTSKPDYQCFAYDGHRRLSEAWTPRTADCATTGRTTANIDGAAPYWHSYTYNSAGQRATETEHTATGDKTTTYTYGTTTGQPHPLAKTTGAKNATYAYDKAGNTTSRPGAQAQQTLTWNSEGKLVGTTEPAAAPSPPSTPATCTTPRVSCSSVVPRATATRSSTSVPRRSASPRRAPRRPCPVPATTRRRARRSRFAPPRRESPAASSAIWPPTTTARAVWPWTPRPWRSPSATRPLSVPSAARRPRPGRTTSPSWASRRTRPRA